MKTNFALFFATLCAFSLGCGAGSSSQQATQSISVAGTWQIVANSSVFGTISVVSGVITQSGNNISGQLTIIGSPCSTSVTLTGTLSGSSVNIALNENGQAVSLSGIVTADGNSASGTYIAPRDGCTNGDSGTWSGTRKSTTTLTLSYLSPATQSAGGGDFTITATGTGFVNTGTYILWNAGQASQVELSSTIYVSSTTLTAIIPASYLTNPGAVPIAVLIPGEISNIIDFAINANGSPGPPLVVSSISASTTSMPATPYCSPNGLTLTVTGQNFDSTSVVNWSGSPRATTFVSATQLTASILPTDTAFPGTAFVSVSAATGSSNSMPFTMTTPSTSLPPPSIISLSQAIVAAGSPSFTLMLTGRSFFPCSVAQWGGTALATSYVSATQVDATVPAADILTAGPGGTPSNVNVTVFTIAPGGGTSGPIVFTITP